VVVIGGGLAGIAAAAALARSGVRCDLLEAQPRLGGLLRSHGQDPWCNDNAQHIFLGCCRHLTRFLADLGLNRPALTALQPVARIPVVAFDGQHALLGSRGPIPSLGPLLGLTGYQLLPGSARLSILRCLSAIYRARPVDPRQSFDEWLRHHRQGAAARRYFWDLIVTPTLNAPPERVASSAALFILRRAFFSGAAALRVGWPRLPLSNWIHPAASSYLQSNGVRLHLRTRAIALLQEESGRIRGVRVRGAADQGETTLATDIVVLALPWHRLPALLPTELARLAPFRGLQRIEAAPIIGVHLAYPRPTGAPPMLAAPDTPLEWLFNTTLIRGGHRSRITGNDPGDGPAGGDPATTTTAATAGPETLSIVLSDARRWLPLPAAEIVHRLRLGLARVLPATHDIAPLRLAVHREPRATIRPSPRTEALRPGARTPIPGLLLAGAWTDTGGWPSTMEGAVISGENAAAAVLHSKREPTRQ
jgi:squalene-associated FAD-dependent desaturase